MDSLFNPDFEHAKEIFANYGGALTRLILKLKKNNENPNEIEALSTHFNEVLREGKKLVPDNKELVNKAIYIYSRALKSLKTEGY